MFYRDAGYVHQRAEKSALDDPKPIVDLGLSGRPQVRQPDPLHEGQKRCGRN
jgi:hypothetical protein